MIMVSPALTMGCSGTIQSWKLIARVSSAPPVFTGMSEIALLSAENDWERSMAGMTSVAA